LIFDPATHQGTPEDHHVHFFFDTTAPENAGTNGNPPGAWTIWDRPKGGGQLVFTEALKSQADPATKMCIAVADANHGVEPNSGNCVGLP
jgi:hypothetical protein